MHAGTRLKRTLKRVLNPKRNTYNTAKQIVEKKYFTKYIEFV